MTDLISSQQVSWWAVHDFVDAVLAQANCGALPWPGTPAWCEMSAGDPRKLLSLAQFGVHHALPSCFCAGNRLFNPLSVLPLFSRRRVGCVLHVGSAAGKTSSGLLRTIALPWSTIDTQTVNPDSDGPL